MQTLLKCVVAASLMVFITQSAGAYEYEHRHLTHEGTWKNRAMPLNFHHGDAFKALDAKKGLAGKFEGPASGAFTRSSDIRRLSAQPHL